MPTVPQSSYDLQVLQPLHQEQAASAERARLAAIQAQEQAAALAAAQLASQEAEAAQAASQQAVVQVSGSCSQWIAEAGITDVADAMTLINMESRCNAWAVNPSSGACNVAQELPCGKSGCALGDGACSVKWLNQYVIDRYGSLASAVAFHNANGWY